MNPTKPSLTDFQWLMLDDSPNEIPSKVWNSMPLSQYDAAENLPEILSALAA